MKNRKVLCILLSLTLMLGMAVPGTLALSADTATVESTANTATPQTVTDITLESSVAKEAVTADVSAIPADTVATAGEAVKSDEPTVAETNTTVNESVDVLMGDALFAFLMEQNEPASLVSALQNLTEAQISSLTEEQISQVEAHIDQVIPPISNQDKGDTLVPGDETVSGPSETRSVTYNYTAVAPFGVPVKGVSRLRTFALRSANNETEEPVDNGLETRKSFAFNDGSSTEGIITLEAWATGESTQTSVTKEVPTDIILVLDQSGSMSDAFDTVTKDSYNKLSNSNMENYPLRQNGGSDNIWYELPKGSFVRVNMRVTQNTDSVDWQTCMGTFPEGKLWNPDMVNWSDQGVLYQLLDDGTYARCYVTRTVGFLAGYDYHYADGTTEHVSFGSNPTQVSADRFFHAEGVVNTYLYFYIDSDGNEATIEKSVGDSTTPTENYYSLVTKSEDRTKLQALMDAVTTFSNSVAQKAKGPDGQANTDDDVNHRIAIVGFASGQSWNGRNYNYGNTEVFKGATQYTYGTDQKNVYSTAFMDMSTSNGVTNVNASINALDADGGTLTNLGLEMANGIFKENPISTGEERNRVVIVFTDGQPGWSGYDSTYADQAVTEAGVSKNTYGATVYTVGIFEGANVNGTDNTNTFMRNMATSGSGYYLTAADSKSLTEIFQKISENIQTGGSTNTKLDQTTVVKDVMSDYFRLPDGTEASNIKVYTADVNPQTGVFENKSEFTNAEVVVNVESQIVTVKNFNFSENWVGKSTVNGEESFRGKKLIIEIPCKVRDGFLGGNNVITNSDGSGVFKDDLEIESFTSPQANVPILAVTVDAPDKNIYLLSRITEAQLKSGTSVNVSNIPLDLTTENYGLESWQTAYVDITDSCLDGDGNAIVFSNLTEDKTYTVSVTVSPKTDGQNASGTVAVSQSNSDAANIYVYKPYIVFQDSSINAGDTPDYGTDNFVSTDFAWKHGNNLALATMGTAPTLTYTYDPAAAALTAETEVKVSVAMNVSENNPQGVDVTEHVSFYRNACAVENDCGFTGGAVRANDANRVNFVVHIKTFDLTIRKVGTETIDHDVSAEVQSYIFHVTGPNNFTMDIVICGDDSKTIKNLPVGVYIITEDESWSWRYSAEDASYQVTPTDINAGVAIVEVVNDRDQELWLNGGAYAHNVFGAIDTSN